MGQRKDMHGGWERERLAEYLLSRFSFVAHPAKVGDDVGSDFFCTIFDSKRIAGHQMLVPRGSFAIQVKSTTRAIKVDNKVDYFKTLELPFFIGVVTQSPNNPGMSIYSAEFLPVLLIHKLVTNKLSLRLVPKYDPTPENYFTRDRRNGYCLKCPLIVTFNVNDDEQAVRKGLEELDAASVRTRKHLTARSSEEHIYEFASSPRIFSGCGSARHFRANFYRRLAEVFANLAWLLNNQAWVAQNPSHATSEPELEYYLSLYAQLQKLNLASEADYLRRAHDRLKACRSRGDNHQSLP